MSLAAPAAAQKWIEAPPIPLSLPADGLVQVAAAPWGDGLYFLDGLRLEVLAADAHGRLRQRYGGWGTGALALDLPRDLVVAENSVFVLDQGGQQILRLDARLNPVSTTPLPGDQLPLAFIRDAQQRFWVTFENQAGLYLYADDGTVLDVVADEASGAVAVLHPSLLAASDNRIAVWDPIDAIIYLFHLSGRLDRRLPLQWERPVLAIEWAGERLLLATTAGLLQVNPADATVTSLPVAGGVIDLAARFPNIYVLDQTGILHVLQPVP
ncbi:MAG: hypothetical protein ACETWG_04160 [Candidatus Neomarinimicrobiota bacterium]